MSIAILAWGSLVYDWQYLTLREPVEWLLGGPLLPIEFSRKSKKDGRLTAVVDEHFGTTVRTRYAVSRLESLTAVVAELKKREGNTYTKWIGALDRDANTPTPRSGPAVVATIRQWLDESPFRSVVWSDMPPGIGPVPKVIEAFEALSGDTREVARDYIAWAPGEVETAARATLARRGLLDGARPMCCRLRTEA